MDVLCALNLFVMLCVAGVFLMYRGKQERNPFIKLFRGKK